MNKPGVMIYFTMRPSRKLPMEDRLRLYDAMLDYGETGVVPELEGPLALLWDYFQPQLELDNARYESIRAKRAKAGAAGGPGLPGLQAAGAGTPGWARRSKRGSGSKRSK